jgi:hypothetical protein
VVLVLGPPLQSVGLACAEPCNSTSHEVSGLALHMNAVAVAGVRRCALAATATGGGWQHVVMAQQVVQDVQVGRGIQAAALQACART